MIVHQIDIESVALFKSEYRPPVGGDPDGPESGKGSAQGMKNEPWGSHIVDLFRALEPGQNPPESSCELLGVRRVSPDSKNPSSPRCLKLWIIYPNCKASSDTCQVPLQSEVNFHPGGAWITWGDPLR